MVLNLFARFKFEPISIMTQINLGDFRLKDTYAKIALHPNLHGEKVLLGRRGTSWEKREEEALLGRRRTPWEMKGKMLFLIN